jgi:hypothetical protein
LIEHVILELCQRNHVNAEDIPFPPPRVSADEVLSELFVNKRITQENRKSADSWALETLIHFIARRNGRPFLSALWREISKLDMASFEPLRTVDLLLWDAPEGHEANRKPKKEQSWIKLQKEANEDQKEAFPVIFRNQPEFALMYFLVYPHRISPALVIFLDKHFGNATVNHEGSKLEK